MKLMSCVSIEFHFYFFLFQWKRDLENQCPRDITMQCIGSAEVTHPSPHFLRGNDGEKSGKLWQYRSSCESDENWYEVKQVQPMWLCLLMQAKWRKVKKMQPMWVCILSERQSEDTFENAQWRKAKEMQPMWLCILSGRQFESTFENAQRRKVIQMQPM